MRSWLVRHGLVGGLFATLFAAVLLEGVALARLYQRAERREQAAAAPKAEEPAARDQAPALPQWSRLFAPLARDPFAEVESLARQMRAGMRDPWPTGAGAEAAGARVDLEEKPDRYVLEIHDADLEHAKVDVHAEANRVTLRIEERSSRSDPKDGSAVQSEERRTTQQAFGLSEEVDAAHMKVERGGDTMTVTLPKARRG